MSADRGLRSTLAGAIVVGAVCGVTWAAALRGYMAELVPDSEVDWLGTFVGVLLPGAITGGLLGAAWASGRSGRRSGIRWFALAPLAFGVVPLLRPGAVEGLFSMGFGGGGIAFAIFAIVGGFAASASRPLWLRVGCGILSIAFLVALVSAAPGIRGPRLALTEARGLWVATLVLGLTVILMLATSIPFRDGTGTPPRRRARGQAEAGNVGSP